MNLYLDTDDNFSGDVNIWHLFLITSNMCIYFKKTGLITQNYTSRAFQNSKSENDFCGLLPMYIQLLTIQYSTIFIELTSYNLCCLLNIFSWYTSPICVLSFIILVCVFLSVLKADRFLCTYQCLCCFLN